MAEDTVPPPPSYDEAVYILRDSTTHSASDPLLGRRSTGTDQSTLSSSARRSQQYISNRQSGQSQSQTHVSDSPHSSDDEETAMLKAELRRLREQDHNEQKKALLRQVIEQERQAAAVSAASEGSAHAHDSRQQWYPPAVIDNYPAGTVIHPMTSNIPGQDTIGFGGPQSYAAPLQCPSTSLQVPGTSTTTVLPDSADAEDGKDNGCAQCVAICVCLAIVIVIIAVVLTYIV